MAVVLDEDDVGSATVEVTFDGETQTVSLADGELDPGRAAPLYDLDDATSSFLPDPAVLTGRMPPGFRSDGQASVTRVTYLPWLPDRGWVEEPGTAWCSVSIRTLVDPSPDVQPESRFGYRLRLEGHTETLDGGRPQDAQLEVQDGAGVGNIAVHGTAVWLVDELPRELVVRHDFAIVAQYGSRPVHRFTTSATVAVTA